MATKQEDKNGFELFTNLYKRKREKQGRRELSAKEFEDKVAGHWKALGETERKRFSWDHTV